MSREMFGNQESRPAIESIALNRISILENGLKTVASQNLDLQFAHGASNLIKKLQVGYRERKFHLEPHILDIYTDHTVSAEMRDEGKLLAVITGNTSCIIVYLPIACMGSHLTITRSLLKKPEEGFGLQFDYSHPWITKVGTIDGKLKRACCKYIMGDVAKVVIPQATVAIPIFKSINNAINQIQF
ncbi:hypothetical protein HGB07_00845 [Candidatus Roizmanbacteria bacterium]|nr:hypothetical protein [Candidatus Roizmanbacteria bacterium]